MSQSYYYQCSKCYHEWREDDELDYGDSCPECKSFDIMPLDWENDDAY